MRQALLVLLGIATLTTSTPAASRNWSYWRGPEQNGVSRERDLPEKWTFNGKTGTNVVFAVPVGSINSPIVHDGVVYILGKSGTGITQQEQVLAFDAGTGKQLWEKKFNVFHTDIVEDRIGFTNMVGDTETGYVYAHLTAGQFLCFDKTGKVIWERSLTEEFGRVTGYGGRVTTPIIDEDKVIVSFVNGSWGEYTIGGTRMVAFDKKTGKIIWWGAGNYRVKDTYYSSPVVSVINGQRLILTGGGDGCIHAFKVRTGEKAWSYKLEDGGGAINCSPVVHGDKIWIGHGEENFGNGTQGRVVCLDGSKLDKNGQPTLVWKYDGVKVKFASPILEKGKLMVCDDAGKLYCFDAEKGGEPLWSFNYGRNTKGSPILADGKIYVSEVDSQFHILKLNEDGCSRLSRVRFPANGFVPTELHGTPAIVNGKVYLTTTSHLICIGKPGHKADPDPIPAAVTEKGKPGAAAFIQVVPGDVSLKPGEKVEFKAVAYDKDGKKIGPVKVDWEKAGMLPPVFPIGFPAPKSTGKPTPPPAIPGTLSAASGETTTFSSSKMPNGQFGRVVAKMGKLTGYARIRMASVVPLTMDFEKVPLTRTPGGWVNTMGKFSVVKLPDGNLVLSKRNDNPSPPIARANAYITDPDAANYSVEADVYGTKVRDDMPDIGVGSMRYTLFLIGNVQELRLVTWDAQKRIEIKKAFPWKPKTWYHMKISAQVVDGKGIVKGKVWPKGEKEPSEWTIEAVDPIPNTHGAGLIYGFANGTINAMNPGPEIYYDNVKITPLTK